MCVGNLARVVAVCAIGLTIALFTPLSAKSDIITYGDFTGADAVFKAVTESAHGPVGTVASGGYGTPLPPSANTLVFTPKAFVADSRGGTPDLIDRQLSMTIAAVGNKVIQTVLFSEAGDYTLVGPGSALTKASVAMPAWLTITKVNGVAIDPIQITGGGVFAPGGGSYMLPANEGNAVPWSGKLNFDVTGALRANGNQGYATEVLLSFDNSLVAKSEANPYTIATIAKKTAQVTVDPQAVPEPGTFVLLSVGAVSLIGYGWRKRRQKSVQNAA